MDFGLLILFVLVAAATLVYTPWVAAAFWKRAPNRFDRLGCLGVMTGTLLLLGVIIYKVHYLDEGLTAAAANGETREALRLLRLGANPDAVFEDGSTALLGAARRGDVQLVKALLTRGADPSLGSDREYRSPLGCAQRNGNKEVVRLLRAAGAVE